MLQIAILGTLLSSTGNMTMGLLMHRPNHQDLETLAEMVATRTITPIIDRRYPLHATADAIRAIGAGQVNGKLVICMNARDSGQCQARFFAVECNRCRARHSREPHAP